MRGGRGRMHIPTQNAKNNKLDTKFNNKFEVGICHPGSISNETGLLNNAFI